MVNTATQQEIQDYFNSPAMSQSLLKTLTKSPQEFTSSQIEKETTRYYEEKGHFIYGSAVDCLLTQGKEVYDSLYCKSTIKAKPGDTTLSITKLAYDTCKAKYGMEAVGKYGFDQSDTWMKELHIAIDAEGYYMNRRKDNWAEDTRLTDMKKKGCYEYLQALIDAGDKQLLSDEESAIIDGIIMSWTTHRYTRHYFQNLDGVDTYNQLVIYFNYRDTECRALLDKVLVDHRSKIIVPTDLKTVGGICYTQFPYSIRERRYDFQAAFYMEALLTWVKKMGFEDYTIAPFRFIVESTLLPAQGTPLIFKASQQLINTGKFGIPILYSETRAWNTSVYIKRTPPVIGFDECIDRYNYHLDHGFDNRMEIMNSNDGVFEVDWQGIPEPTPVTVLKS